MSQVNVNIVLQTLGELEGWGPKGQLDPQVPGQIIDFWVFSNFSRIFFPPHSHPFSAINFYQHFLKNFGGGGDWRKKSSPHLAVKCMLNSLAEHVDG